VHSTSVKVASFELEKLGKDCIQESVELLAKSFCKFDPIEIVLGITESEFIDMVNLDIPQILNDSLSSVVRDPFDSKMVAAIIVLDAATDFADSKGKISQKFLPVAKIVNQLHDPYLNRLRPLRGEIAYIYMAAVDEQYQGHGIATKLFRDTEKYLQTKSYKTVFTISTNRASSIALERNGFVPLESIAYGSFQYEGCFPFQLVSDIHSVTLLAKQLTAANPGFTEQQS